MFIKFYDVRILICLICMVILTGCTKPQSFKVNTGTMGHEADVKGTLNFNDSSKKTNYEMVKLKNGVIIYKDHSRIKDTDVPHQAVRFGPDNLNFHR